VILLVISVLVAAASAWSVRAARQLAVRRALLDIPNERSSHRVPVPRLGGAAFVPVLAVALGLWAGWAGRLGLPGAALLAGVILLYSISLADDFLTLPTGIRFAVQGVAAGLLLAAVFPPLADRLDFLGTWFASGSAAGAPGLSLTLVLSLLGLGVWLVGTVNLYNFMDGIDGIAGLQAVVAGLAWAAWGQWLGAPFVSVLGLLSAAAAVGFLTLNWPPARIFMGDAGSTVLGFLFAAAPLLAAVESQLAFDRLLIAAALALWPFLVDGTFTIFRRLGRGENILQAHRSHLYQRLVIAGQTHRRVTLVYGALAAVGVAFGTLVVRGVPGAVPLAIGGVGLCFLGLWRWVCRVEERVVVVGRPPG
jgi:UDP-N-acetylmuramyl pentapeptide phosphotransferase/UDP-N-acetylglucosamine-1-phosphate transferase